MPREHRFAGGATVRAAREGKNLTREAVGVGVGRSAKSIELYENGGATPPYSVRLRLAALLELKLGDLDTPAQARTA